VTRFTHLGRVLDPRYPSNIFVVMAAAVLGGVALLIGGWSPEPEWGGPVAVGLATFLAWAAGRELDPDRPTTAMVAAVLGALFLLVVAARILVRTTGLAPLWTDLAANLAIAAWLAQSVAGWVGGMALAFAVARDTGLRDPAPARNLWWAGAMAVAVTLVASVSGALGGWVAPAVAMSALAAAGVLGAAFFIGPDTPTSVGDFTSRPLDPRRLQEARILILVAAALTAVIAGDEGLRAFGPVWTLLAVGGAVRIARRRTPASA
jgi:hypothetical protein